MAFRPPADNGISIDESDESSGYLEEGGKLRRAARGQRI